MKTLKTFLVLILLYSIVWAQTTAQEIKSVNKWSGRPDSRTFIDLIKTKSQFTTNGTQAFHNFGTTTYPAFWNFDVFWKKDLLFYTPDTILVEARLVSIERLTGLNVIIQLRGSNRFVALGNQSRPVPVDGKWVTLKFSMEDVKKFGLINVDQFVFELQNISTDSCSGGTVVEFKNLRGYYNDTKELSIYDTFSDITSAPAVGQIPTKFVLYQNYPNPFNPSTKIRFEIPESGNYTLKVYNAIGQEVTTLIEAYLAPGVQEYSFDGSNLPTGPYFYRLVGKNISLSNKMMLMK